MTNDTVFGSANWIWNGRHYYNLVNTFLEARKVFSVESIPEKVIINVTADTRYRLYVNGKHLNRGPARGFQESWPYDTIDITPFLKKGDNVIGAVVQSLGIGTFSYIHKGLAGFILDGKIDDLSISTNETWKIRKSPGYKHTLSRVSVQLGFQEVYDAGLEDGNWLSAEYNDSHWNKPEIFPSGGMPWHSFEEREIPLLREETVFPESIISFACGTSRENYQQVQDITALYCEEEKDWKEYTGAQNITSSGLTFTVKPSGTDKFKAFCIDFGFEIVGSIRITAEGIAGTAEGAAGGEIIDTVVCESVNVLKPDFTHPDTNLCACAFGNRLLLNKGKTEHEQYDHWGFRYAVVIVRNAETDLKISISLSNVLYPLNITGGFKCSDTMLNDIYSISVRTQQCCILDAYMDCPWREQAQWWGDARVQAANTFYLSADARLLKRGIRQIGTQEVPNGLTYGHTPTIASNCILPDFTLTWIITHLDYYKQTGDLSLFKNMRERVHRAFAYFEDIQAENGLIPYDNRYWLFMDWCDIVKDGFPALFNLFYLLALRSGTELFTLTGNIESAEKYGKLANKLYKSILLNLWNEKTGEFYGGLTIENEPVSQNSPHVYSLAVLLNILPEKHDSFVKDRLLPLVNGNREQEIVPSPYFMYYIFEALKKKKKYDEIISCIRRWWGEMVNEGLSTTKEIWNPGPGEWSLCHAWSAHPIVHFSNIILGINQSGTGWREILFSPQFGDLKNAAGAVATPFGTVETKWERSGNKINVMLNIPEGITAQADFGPIKERISAGRHKWEIEI